MLTNTRHWSLYSWRGTAIKPGANHYDTATKRLINQGPAAFGALFDIPLSGNARLGPTELNLAEIHVDRRNADMVMTDDGRVIHLELQRCADPTMADRMLIYRSLLRAEPAYAGKPMQQHVIVMGNGTSPSRIDEPPDLSFSFTTHYARDLDLAKALTSALSAPWAILAPSRDEAERAARLAHILRIVSSDESDSVARDLVKNTLTFASIVLPRKTVERVLKESGMSTDMVDGTPWAEEVFDEGHAAGVTEGRRRSIRDNPVRILERRGLDRHQADRVASALIAEDENTAVERAAFDEPDQLTALAD